MISEKALKEINKALHIGDVRPKQNNMENQKYYKKQKEAILNDTRRKELFKQLFELYTNTAPIILKHSNGRLMFILPDSAEAAAERITDDIEERQTQIFNSFKTR